MSEIQQDLSASALVHAIEANMFEFTQLLHDFPQVEVHHDSQMIWTISDIPFPLFNVVHRAQLEPEKIDAAIDAAITRCKSRRVPMLWRIGPSTMPVDLGVHLESHGFASGGETPGMAVDLHFLNVDLPTPLGLTIEQVKDIEMLKKWRRVFATGFGLPGFVADAIYDFMVSLGFNEQVPFRNYIAFLNGEPIAISSVFYGAGVAGIYNVATLPDMRRRGIGSIVTLTPLLVAREVGYRIGILHASELGFNVYHKLGFQEYCTLVDYVWSP